MISYIKGVVKASASFDNPRNLVKIPLDKIKRVCYNKYCKYFKCDEGKKVSISIFREPLFGAKRYCDENVAPPRAGSAKECASSRLRVLPLQSAALFDAKERAAL